MGIAANQGKVVLKGTHGTTQQRAQSIQLNGFQAGKGRGGLGAYFWRDSGKRTASLALEWFEQSRNFGRYNDELSPKCAVIYCDIEIAPEEKLDLEQIELKDKLAQLLEDQGYGLYPSDIELSNAHDLLVFMLEKELGYNFKVLESRVAAPRPSHNKPSTYPVKALGSPIAYICRRPRPDWIKITSVVPEDGP